MSLAAGLAVLLGGCIIVSGDDDVDGPVIRPDAYVPLPPDAAPAPLPDAYVPEFGDLLVEWTLVSGLDEVVLDACPDGTLDARVIMDPDPDPESVGDEIYELYDCDDFGGVTLPIEPGVYDVVVQVGVFDSDGELVELHAQSDVTTITSDYDTTTELSFLFSVDYADVALSWDVFLNGQLSTCDELAAAGVAVQSTPVGDMGTLFDTTIVCSEGAGVTDPMPLGEYTIAVQLVDIDDFGLPGHEAETFPNVILDYGNEHEDLGDVELLVVE
ncbi:MAG: hypothetical protein Tsb0020_53130 [Haliangiales bacterium]